MTPAAKIKCFLANGSGFAVGSTNNASSDATGNTGNLASGKINQTSYSSYFINTTVGSENLHLKTTDVALREAGADLSTDAAGASFNYDIDGDSRPIGPLWDIGADEAQLASSSSSSFIATEY